ncbi:MAG: outer membrane protein assembly factor BamB [Gammaproteobacteria bacterium]|nr:outer membrane protein assembly factor BamB [Gammaproteobacteria bacterium]
MIRRLIAIISATAVLAACATKDNVEPPAELQSFEPAVDVRQVWSVNLGKGEEGLFLGLVPATDGVRIYAASIGGEVTAYDIASGKAQWRYSVKRDDELRESIGAKTLAFSGGPGAAQGLVAIGSSDGELIVLDAVTGERLWHRTLSSMILAAPAITPDAVIVRTVDGRLFALSSLDGSEMWMIEQELPPLTLRGNAAPVVSNGLVIAGFDNGKLLALDEATGQTVWELPVGIPRGRSELETLVDVDGAMRVFRDEIVYVAGFQGNVLSVALENGQPLWDREFSSFKGLGLDWENIYVTDEDSQVWALDRRNGGPLWTQTDMRARTLTAPVAYGDTVVSGDFEGYLHFLDKNSGALVGRVRLGKGAVVMPPVVVEGLLIVLTEDAKLGAFVLRDNAG